MSLMIDTATLEKLLGQRTVSGLLNPGWPPVSNQYKAEPSAIPRTASCQQLEGAQEQIPPQSCLQVGMQLRRRLDCSLGRRQTKDSAKTPDSWRL